MAVFNNNTTLSLGAYISRVGYRNNRMAFVMQFTENLHDQILIGFVQVPCRFIGQKDDRIINQSASNANTLLFAAG